MASAIVLKLEDASWRQPHEELVRLATERAGLDFEEGRWLVRAHRSGAHLRLGYASFQEYTERLFGYGPRLTQEKLRIAEALEELPETAGDLQTGTISFSLARELTRVATPSTEKEWLEAARGRTLREVEHLVSGHRPGSLPDDVPDSQLKRHVLRLDLSGEVFATFREAMAKIRRDAGESLDDDAAMLLLCRQALEGPKDPGRSSYQIALTVCESCRRGKQQGRGELIEVRPEMVEMAECDGQHIGHVDSYLDVPDASSHTHVGVHDDVNIRVGVLDDEKARVDLVGNPRAHVGATRVRATQTIPPALRRAVLRRDGGKCRVSGCRHAVFTDVHHIRAPVGRRQAQPRQSRDPLLSAPLREPQRKAHRLGLCFLAALFRPCRRHAVRRRPRPHCCRRASDSLSGAHVHGLPRGPSQTSPRTSPEDRLLPRAADPASASRARSSVAPSSTARAAGRLLARGRVAVSYRRISPDAEHHATQQASPGVTARLRRGSL
jgi:hypothetical protein